MAFRSAAATVAPCEAGSNLPSHAASEAISARCPASSVVVLRSLETNARAKSRSASESVSICMAVKYATSYVLRAASICATR